MVRTVIRDALSFALGAFVILHQELSGSANYLAWTFGLACILGVPGVNAVSGLWRGNPDREPGTTTESSSSSSSQGSLAP